MRWRVLAVAAAVFVATYGVAGMDEAPAEHATGLCRSLHRPDLRRVVPKVLAGHTDMPRYTDVRAPTPAQLTGLYPVHDGPDLDSTVCLVTRGGRAQLMVVTEHIDAKYYGPPPDRSMHDATCVQFVDATTHDRHRNLCF